MKILLLIPALGTVYGGPSKLLPLLAGELGRRGLQIDLVATNADGAATLDAPVGRWIEQDGYRLRYFSRLGRAEYKLSFALAAWLARHVAEYDLAHIHSDFNFPVLVAASACRWRKVPYLLTPHGMLEPWALGYKAWKKRAYYERVERPLVLRGARALHALNRSEAANIEALKLGPPVVVLPNGIDPSEAGAVGPAKAEVFLERFPALRGKKLILFLHRIDPKKGLDILASAYRQVRERFPQTHLVVAGPDTTGYTPAARGFFEAAGCADAVTFTGMLEGDAKHGALASASVFVTPSYSEGFSMSVLEAMAAGLPCVLTEGCNFPEAGEAGAARILPTGDADRFARELLDLLDHPETARTVGARASELVLSRYTWPRVAEEYERMLGRILSA